MIALMAATLGTFASAEANVVAGALTNQGYETAGSSRTTDSQAVDERVDVSRSLDRPQLELQAAKREKALQEVDRDITAAAKARERKIRAQQEKRRKQWVLPVKGYRLTARFGQQSSLWSSGAHTGLDFAGPSGTKIVSAAAGTVTSVGYEGSYGNRTVVRLRDGTKISYCHQSRFAVKVGDRVQPGQLIGYLGATGNVTGPHLHLEIELPGAGQVDPARVLRKHGVTP